MANDLNTRTALTTRSALISFDYYGHFISNIRDESEKFSGKVYGDSAKLGTSINVKKPVRFKATGTDLSGTLDVQDIIYDFADLALTTYKKVHTSVPTLDETIKLDSRKDDIIVPSAHAIVIAKERDHAQVIEQVGQAVWTGVTGATSADLGQMNVIMAENGATGEQKCIMGSDLQESISNGISTYFAPTEAIKDGFYKGEVKSAKNFKLMTSELLPIHTNGTANDGAYGSDTDYPMFTPLGTVNATIANGAKSVALTGIDNDGTITAGSIVYFEDTIAVNNDSYDTTGRIRGFAVLEDATVTAGAVTLSLAEEIYSSTTLQNVTLLPTATKKAYLGGKVSTSYKQGIGFVKDAFMQGFANLTKPAGGVEYSMQKRNGIIVRSILKYEDGTSGDTYADSNVCRVDSVSGVSLGRSEMAVRLMHEI